MVVMAGMAGMAGRAPWRAVVCCWLADQLLLWLCRRVPLDMNRQMNGWRLLIDIAARELYHGPERELV